MKLRPLIKQSKAMDDKNIRLVVGIMGLIGLIVGGFLMARFIINLYF